MPEVTTDLSTMNESQLEAVVNRMVNRRAGMIDNRRLALGKSGGLMYGLRNGSQDADRKFKTGMEWMMAAAQKDHSYLRAAQANYRKELDEAYNSGEINSVEYYTLAPANEGTNSAGGYNVPVPLATEISRNVGEYGFARRYFRMMPIPGKVLDLSGFSVKPSAAVYAENATIAATKPTADKLTLTAKKIAAIYPATNEYLSDMQAAGVEGLKVVLELLGEQVQITEDTNAFANDATNWPGLLYYGAGAITSGIAANGAIAVSRSNSSTGGKTGYPQIGDTAGSTDTWSDLMYCLQAQKSSLMVGAKIFMPQEVLIAALSLRIANGTFIGAGPSNLQVVSDGEGLSRYFYCGYEIVPIPAGIMMTYDASAHVSTPYIVITNPMRSWSCMGIRDGFFVDMSSDATADSVNAFTNDLTLFRVKERVAFGTARPEQMVTLRTDAS